MPTMPAFDLTAFGVSFADYLLTHTAAFGVLCFAAVLFVAGCITRVLEARWDRVQQQIAEDRQRQALDRARLDTVVRISEHRARRGGNEAA